MQWDPDAFAGGNGTVANTARNLTTEVHAVVRNHLQFLKPSAEKETESSDSSAMKIEDELKRLEETGAELLREHKGLTAKVKRGSGSIPAATLASIESLVHHFQEWLLIVEKIISSTVVREDGLDDATYIALVGAMRDTALVVATWLRDVAYRCRSSKGGSDAFEMIRTTNNATSVLFHRIRSTYDADIVECSDDDEHRLLATSKAFESADMKKRGTRSDSDASDSTGDELSD
jgi:hypothetical protein